MLESFFEANSSIVSDLANSWLCRGVSGFSVWSADKALASWPSEMDARASFLCEAIQVKGKKVGELRLTGSWDSSTKTRLQMDATLLAKLVDKENELRAMAAEWIDTRDQLIALYNMTHHTGASLDLDQSLESLASETLNVTRAETVFIALQLADSPLRVTHFPKPSINQSSLSTYLQKLRHEKRDFLFVDLSKTGALGSNNHLLILPFAVRGAEMAALGIQTQVGRSSLSPLVKLLQTIAEFAGTHIENLLMVLKSMELARFHTEMELARNVQRSLLPVKLPAFPGLDIWAGARPASVVGGDFYDFIEKPGQPLTFTVADISGKGIPASIPMAMTRTLIRSQANGDQLPGPEMILQATNTALYEDFSQLGVFATVFVGQYTAAKNELLFANAGHSPVIYYQAAGTARLLQANDIPVGLLPGTLFKNQMLHLFEGDILVIGTDGLYEVHDVFDHLLGFDSLIEQVVSLSNRSAKEIAESLLQMVADYRGNEHQEDDQTLIVIKRTHS